MLRSWSFSRKSSESRQVSKLASSRDILASPKSFLRNTLKKRRRAPADDWDVVVNFEDSLSLSRSTPNDGPHGAPAVDDDVEEELSGVFFFEDEPSSESSCSEATGVGGCATYGVRDEVEGLASLRRPPRRASSDLDPSLATDDIYAVFQEAATAAVATQGRTTQGAWTSLVSRTFERNLERSRASHQARPDLENSWTDDPSTTEL